MEEELSSITEIIMGKIGEWYEALIVMLPNFVVAVLIVIVFALIARLIRNLSKKLFSKIIEKKAIINLLGSIIYGIVIIGGVMIALGVMDLEKTVTSFLAGLGIIGLALGFAFQDIAANFISGLLLAGRSPFRVGDIIKTNDLIGKVQRINLRDTELHSLQGEYISIPNKDIFENPIQNLSKPPIYRVDLACGVSYGDDLEKARDVAVEALQEIPNRIEDREIKVHYTDFGGSSINFVTQVWINYNGHQDFLYSRSEAIIALKKALDEAEISIPFPIRTLDFGIESGGGVGLDQMLKKSNSED